MSAPAQCRTPISNEKFSEKTWFLVHLGNQLVVIELGDDELVNIELGLVAGSISNETRKQSFVFSTNSGSPLR